MARWGAYRGKSNRFNHRPTQCRQGYTHHSAMEAARCDELHAMLAGGLIRDLQAHPQPSYRLIINEIEICKYMADFAYVNCDTGEPIVEDVKGYAGDTAVYRLKRRLMLACHDIDVQEVRSVRGRR